MSKFLIHPRYLRLLASTWCSGALTFACAANQQDPAEPAAPSSVAPASPSPSSGSAVAPAQSERDQLGFRDLSDAVRAFDHARREVDELLMAERVTTSSDDEMASGAPTAPKASAPTAQRSESANDRPEPSEAKRAPRLDRCSSICRALNSMARATQGICRIAGDTSVSCREANAGLARSQTRAATCSCPHE